MLSSPAVIVRWHPVWVGGGDLSAGRRTDARARLVAGIARGRRWLAELIESATTVEAIAARERCSVRKVNMTVSLAFLAPSLVRAAIEGRLPRGIGLVRLCDLPVEWPRQYQALGLVATE